MKTLKVVRAHDFSFDFELRGKYPCSCTIHSLRFHETEPSVNMQIDWHNKGRYSNGQRKKMVARTINKLLRRIVRDKDTLKFLKENHV